MKPPTGDFPLPPARGREECTPRDGRCASLLYRLRSMRSAVLSTTALIALGIPSAALAQRAVPAEHTLSSGWEMRVEAAAPAEPQPAPPEETEPDAEGSSARLSPPGRAAQSDGPW